MRKTISFLLCILFYTSYVSGQNWQTYPYSPLNTVLSFPADDGKHASASTTTEWWYTNLHVIGSAPDYKVYDVMLAYFNKPGSMRIFNMAMPGTGVFHTNVINLQAPTALSAKTGHWEFTYTVPSLSVHDTSKWTFPTDGIPYRYHFHTENPADNDGLDVTLTGNRPPLNVGGDGFIPIGSSGDSSFYYSYTNLKVEGTIKFGGINDVITSGIAWIDRQWGPFTVGYNPNNLYEWFSMQLDKPGIKWGSPQMPSEFNIWQIFSDTNNVPLHSSSRLLSTMYADKSQDTTSGFIYERTSYWYDQANKVYYSSGWRLINPKQNITLDMTPTIPNQVVNVTLFKFWEGATNVTGVVQNQKVEGIGFAELVAKHKYEIKTPSAPSGLLISGFTDHNTISWNTSQQGTYPVGGYRVFRSASNNGHWKYLATTTQLHYDDYTATRDSTFYYTVTSFDNQTATSASAYATGIQLGIHPVPAIDNSVNIFPNPAKNKITINCAGKPYLNVFIYNTAGQLMLKHSIHKGANDIDIHNLSKGEYIIKLTGSSPVMQQKLIVE
jgi:predicted secreted hydrolase